MAPPVSCSVEGFKPGFNFNPVVRIKDSNYGHTQDYLYDNLDQYAWHEWDASTFDCPKLGHDRIIEIKHWIEEIPTRKLNPIARARNKMKIGITGNVVWLGSLWKLWKRQEMPLLIMATLSMIPGIWDDTWSRKILFRLNNVLMSPFLLITCSLSFGGLYSCTSVLWQHLLLYLGPRNENRVLGSYYVKRFYSPGWRPFLSAHWQLENVDRQVFYGHL